MGRIFQSLLVVLIVSVGLLMLGGLVLDIVQHSTRTYHSFFRYRIDALNDAPFWFIAILLQLAINGIWLPRLSRYIGNSDFSPFRQDGRVTWNVPVQYGVLFGKNLVVVVAILVSFLLLQGLNH